MLIFLKRILQSKIIFALLFFIVIGNYIYAKNTDINNRISYVFNEFEKNESKGILAKLIEDVEINSYVMDDIALARLAYLKLSYNNENYNLTKKSLKEIDGIIEKSILNKDIYLEGVCYHFKVILELYNKDYDKAINYSQKAINTLKTINKEHSLIDSYYNLSIAYLHKEEWQNTISSAKQSLVYINKLETKKNRISHLNIRIATSYLKLKNIRLTEKHLNFVLQQNPYILKNNYKINLVYAELYALKGELEKSNTFYFKALGINRKDKKNKLEIFDINTKKELFLKNELNNTKIVLIKHHNYIIVVIILLFLFTIFFLFKLNSLNSVHRNNLSEIKLLNKKLTKINLNIKTLNLELFEKKKQNELIMLNNEKSLFSKILKISTYNDAVKNILTEISFLMNKSKITTNKLIHIKNKLSLIVNEDVIWNDLQIQYENTKPNFFRTLKNKCKDLTINELKHCAYIDAGLKIKEVANLSQVSFRSVESARYRIKKKLNIDHQTKLSDYIKILTDL